PARRSAFALRLGKPVHGHAKRPYADHRPRRLQREPRQLPGAIRARTYTPTSPAGGPFYDHTAFVEARTTDANCAYVPGQSARATSGAVTLTRVTNGTFAGTFDVMLESGNRLTGSFEVLDCPAIGGTSDGGTVGSCG